MLELRRVGVYGRRAPLFAAPALSTTEDTAIAADCAMHSCRTFYECNAINKLRGAD